MLPEPTGPRRSSISLTPLIDVVFILLLFFMLTSSFVQWRAVDLSLSVASEGGQTSQDAPGKLHLQAAGQLYLNGQLIGPEELPHIHTSYRLTCGADVRLQQVLQLLDDLQRRGIQNVSFVGVAPAEQGRGS